MKRILLNRIFDAWITILITMEGIWIEFWGEWVNNGEIWSSEILNEFYFPFSILETLSEIYGISIKFLPTSVWNASKLWKIAKQTLNYFREATLVMRSGNCFPREDAAGGGNQPTQKFQMNRFQNISGIDFIDTLYLKLNLQKLRN